MRKARPVRLAASVDAALQGQYFRCLAVFFPYRSRMQKAGLRLPGGIKPTLRCGIPPSGIKPGLTPSGVNTGLTAGLSLESRPQAAFLWRVRKRHDIEVGVEVAAGAVFAEGQFGVFGDVAGGEDEVQ